MDDPNAVFVGFKRFVESAMGDHELELELSLDIDVTPSMFTRLIKTLTRTVCSPSEIIQLDVPRGNSRMEYVGEESVSAALSSDESRIVRPTRAMLKRRERAPIPHDKYEFTIKLKREIEDKAELTSGTVNIDAFRLKRRFTFPVLDVCKIDCTIVQSRSVGETSQSIPFTFEIEIEMVNEANSYSSERVCEVMTDVATNCMSILRGTSAAITKKERKDALQAYGIVTGLGPKAVKRLVGPQPVTLMRSHVLDHASDSPGDVWNGDYSVTDKADGTRCQLFVHDSMAYTLDFTLTLRRVCDHVSSGWNGTWLDGELICSGRNDEPMNLFACFDAYRIGDRDVTKLPLIGRNSRTALAEEVIASLLSRETLDSFTACVKKFERVSPDGDATRSILENARLGYAYETDGLVFTPIGAPVGGRFPDDDVHVDGTWYGALKWKPAESNTIDMVVRSSHVGDKNGYREFIVLCSYTPREWETIDVMRFIQFGDRAIPSEVSTARPFDLGGPDSSRMRVRLDASGRATCMNDDVVYDNTVIECSYRDNAWIPLRSRPEKTARLRKKGPSIAGAANNWSTAKNVWNSINFEVTEDVIMRKVPCPADLGDTYDDDVYYSRRQQDRSRSALRNLAKFHNTHVKATLYADAASNCSASGTSTMSLFEFACGKGGDMNRWLAENFTRVVGTDLSMDNITNSMDGAYRRYANLRQTNKKDMADKVYAFACMDATMNMQPPLDEVKVAAKGSPHGDLIAALWDAYEDTSLTKTSLTPYRGLVLSGFDVVSCQFAIHYMFENSTKLNRFVENVAWLCNPGGVFIGTCFDGDSLSKTLESRGGSISGKFGTMTAWKVTQRYSGRFDGSTGAAVDVYVETINKPATEFLVSVPTLCKRMEAQGMELVFVRPFESYFTEYPRAQDMTPTEKELSFKYVAFMFRKNSPDRRKPE